MKRSFRQYYLDLPIRSKILLWFIPLLSAMIGATGVFSYRIAAGEIVTKMQLTQTGTANQVVDQLNFIAQDAIDLAGYLFLTPEIQRLFSNDGDYGTVSKAVTDSINHLMVTRPYFQFLTLYSPHFDSIQFNNKGLSTAIPFEEYRKRFGYDVLISQRVTDTWRVEAPGLTPTVFRGDPMNKLLLTQVLKNDTDYSPEGVILIGILERDIRQSYLKAVGNSEIVVFDDDGAVLTDSTGRWVGHSMSELPYFRVKTEKPAEIDAALDRRQWVSARVQSSLTGWHVLVLQPRSDLLKQLNRIQWLTIAIACITLLLSFIVAWAISGVIAGRIRHILASMKKFQKGDFSQQVAVSGQDEMGQLGAGYNIMVQRIKELIDDVYAFELKQKQAELKVLQSQINPHFLYNTLNTIAWTAHKNGDPLTAEMIYSLSGIFKISLSEGRDFISLRQELRLVEHYLYLQKMRFPDKLTYEIEADETAKSMTVPKLLLQPLVENAVVHGIEPLTDDVGSVFVKVSAADEFAEIEVTDNGIGIAADKLAVLRKKLFAERAERGENRDDFALLNIVDRIRMIYGDSASIGIHSVAGSGTRIHIRLPIRKR